MRAAGITFAAPRMMAAFLLVVVVSFAHAQKGTAPPGYYPTGYMGDTFRGKLVELSDDGLTVTLEHVRGKKTERFVGTLAEPCKGAKTGNPVDLSGLVGRAVFTAYYRGFTERTAEGKVRRQVIIGMQLDEVDGKSRPTRERVPIPCTEQRFETYKAFSLD